MCLILFAAAAHPEYPLIVAANRDEAYARSASAANFWRDEPDVYGGRDLERGGTWLALSRAGRFSAVTNYRRAIGGWRADAPRSRGDLTRQFLTSQDEPADYVRRIEGYADDFNGFSLLVGGYGELWFYSNRGGLAQRVSNGVHGLSNHLLDEPWPKVRRGIAELTALLAADEDTLSERLIQLLADRTVAPDHLLPSTGLSPERERASSASFIAGATYGTRASTVVLVASSGDTLFIERRYGPGGTFLGQSAERFKVDAAPWSAPTPQMQY